MSSADDLTLGDDASGSEVLASITNYLSSGGSVATLLSSSILGLVVSPFVGAIDIINAIVGFFTTPFEEVADAVATLSSAFFEEPGQLISRGFEISASTLSTYFGDTFAGLFAGPIGIGLVMLSLYLIIQYLEVPETGDTLPAVPIDVPFLGVEEDDEE